MHMDSCASLSYEYLDEQYKMYLEGLQDQYQLPLHGAVVNLGGFMRFHGTPIWARPS